MTYLNVFAIVGEACMTCKLQCWLVSASAEACIAPQVWQDFKGAFMQRALCLHVAWGG